MLEVLSEAPNIGSLFACIGFRKNRAKKYRPRISEAAHIKMCFVNDNDLTR